MDKILKDIKLSEKKKGIFWFVLAVLFSVICFLGAKNYIVFSLLFLMCLTFWYLAICCYRGYKYPEKNRFFEKFDSIDKVIEEIKNSIEVRCGNIVVSDEYICDLSDFRKMIRCSDVLKVSSVTKRKGFSVYGYRLVVLDKYGDKVKFSFEKKDRAKMEEITRLIISKCEK